MKKAAALILSVMLVFLCACSNEKVGTDDVTAQHETLPAEATTADSAGIEQVEPAQVFTVYFSYNDPVESAAQFICEKTGCEAYRIETYVEYPANEAELQNQIKEEHLENARPALKGAPVSLGGYDIVFLFFPAWDGTMPMALFTFIEDYDMRDKVVVPVICGTSGQLSQAMADIHKIVPSMLIVNGYAFTGDISRSEADFGQWIDNVLYG